VGQIKRGQLSFWLVTTECNHKIFMIYCTYKLHKATSDITIILSKWKRKDARGRHEWTLQQDCAIVWYNVRNSVAYTDSVRMSPAVSQTPSNSDLNRVDHAIWGPCRSESIPRRQKVWHVDQLKQAIVLEWRALPRTTALHSSQRRLMDTSFAVSRVSKWRTHWSHVSLL